MKFGGDGNILYLDCSIVTCFLFKCVIGYLHVFFEEMSIHIFCPFYFFSFAHFKLSYLSFITKLQEFFTYFELVSC